MGNSRNEKNLQEQKKMLRREVKQAISMLSKEYCREADEHIYKWVCAFSDFQNADTIFCFVGTETEIDTRPLLEEILRRGKRLGVPKCTGAGIMEVYEIHSLNDLESGSYGILEPKDGFVRILPEQIDLALVPCLSCNEAGWRLGYGGGFYDRYLERTSAKRAVLCRNRLMRSDIPAEAFDLNMDVVITEKGILSVR